VVEFVPSRDATVGPDKNLTPATSYLSLDDTPASFTALAVSHVNAAGDAIVFDSNFTWNGTVLDLTGGDIHFDAATTILRGTSTTESKLFHTNTAGANGRKTSLSLAVTGSAVEHATIQAERVDLQNAKMHLRTRQSNTVTTVITLDEAGLTTVQNDIHLGGDLLDKDDTDTGIIFSGAGDRLTLQAGNVTFIGLTEDATDTLTLGTSAAMDVEIAHASGKIGMHGAAAVAQQTVSGARDDPEAALANLLTALDTRGDIVDSTTAS